MLLQFNNMSISIKEIYWLAGILEGEGSFNLKDQRYPRIQIAMTDVDIIEKVRCMISPHTSICVHQRAKENIKCQYSTSLTGQLAIEWMFTLYSLMGIRRKKQIKKVIELWKIIEYDKDKRNSSINQRNEKWFLDNGIFNESELRMANILRVAGFSKEEILEKLEVLKKSETTSSLLSQEKNNAATIQ